MAFWNQVTIEPKRTFRYLVTFGADLGKTPNASQISMFATSVDRPKFEVSFKEFQYLNHQFNFPGRLKWQDIKMKFTDAGGSGGNYTYETPDPNDSTQYIKKSVNGGAVLDIAQMMMKIVTNGGYSVPTDPSTMFKTLNKTAMHSQIGQITISILKPDANGSSAIDTGKVVEQWILYNAMFGSVDFSSLTYDNEDFSTVDLTIKYDYAKIWGGKDQGGQNDIYIPNLT